ncbi:MAG: tetratricopeptide repeat protein [Bacteroidetes bacterium]|nr:tetratricopeptide repeat protein [Bacteroidota bacterium]
MKYLFNYFLFYVLLTASGNKLFAQQSYVDSIKRVLEKTSADTARIDLMNKLAGALAFSDYDKAAEYANKALELSQTINSKQRIVQSMLKLGMISRERGNFDKALPYYLSALKISEEISYKFGIGASSNTIGTIYQVQSNFPKALEYLNQSLTIAKELDSKSGMSACLSNIGQVYQSMGDCEKTLYYNSEALKVDETMDDKHDLALGLNNVGVAYAMNCSVTGFPNLEKALEYFQKAYDVYLQINELEGMAMSLNNIAHIYLEQKDYTASIEISQKALTIAMDIGSKEDVRDAYENLSRSYNETNDFKNAYEFHKLYSDMKDSLLNEESSKQITEMQTKYETEKKEQQITLLNKDKELQDAQLNRQKIIIWSVAGGLLIVLILSIFIFRERRKSEKLLLNILPAETAKELKAKGKATAKHYESVTVMFTDFKGFTTIAEQLSAEELVSELDILFRKFDEIISNYSIEKIKTIGDAYMCACGLPTPNSNHAENIVKAGLEIQQWMTNQNSKWNLRIGIHSGPVTAGVVGDKKFAYDIWGDTVNTASRMESGGETGKVNISESTHRLLLTSSQGGGTALEFIYRGEVEAKNKGKIKMYFVEKKNSSLPFGES